MSADLDLDALREAAEKATPGPWWRSPSRDMVFSGEGGSSDQLVGDELRPADAEFIARAGMCHGRAQPSRPWAVSPDDPTRTQRSHPHPTQEEPMTVGELIAKLTQLPPSTIVVTDDNECFDYDMVSAFRFRARVERTAHGSTFVRDDDGRSDVETVVLISMFGHDDKEEL